MTADPAAPAAPDATARSTAPSARRLDARTRWSIRLGLVVLRLLARTWRLEVSGRPADPAVRGSRPLVLALWHGEMLPCLWAHRDGGANVLISEHRDGEIIAHIVRAFGQRAVRGSTSRGGARALLALAAKLRAGEDIALTPDGPRGPRHSIAPGVVAAAQRGSAPIVPMRAAASRAWRLRSWDAFLLPKPFARVSVLYGAPIDVAAASTRDLAPDVDRLHAAMRALGARAAGRVGVAPDDAAAPEPPTAG